MTVTKKNANFGKNGVVPPSVIIGIILCQYGLTTISPLKQIILAKVEY